MASTAVIDLRILERDKDKEVYQLRGRCGNCGWSGRVLIPKGEERPGASYRYRPGTRRTATCPNCGCSEVVCPDV